MSWNTGSSGYGPSPHAPAGYRTTTFPTGCYPPPGPPSNFGGYSPLIGQYRFPITSAPMEYPDLPPSPVQHYGPEFEGADGQKHRPYFQNSMCSGKKKALCIGINYTGASSELRGCINDARNVRNFLIRTFGYKEDDIVFLTDDSHHPAQIPTRANMIRAMQWLVRDARPHDSLFFHYSGHGGQAKDEDGDEDDGYDETIFPVDFQTSGQIVDDELFFTMVKPLPAGCRLTSCHSGSYSTEGKIKEPNLLAEAGQGLLQSGMAYVRGDSAGALSGLVSLVKEAVNTNSGVEHHAKQTRTSPADAISWSGCKDNQTSADTVEVGQSTGAMSFVSSSRNLTSRRCSSLMDTLPRKYSQKPQLSSSHPMDTNALFIC
ncbi:hypothetical protein BS47DRAFT_1372759 [Hydnum rufescens UP504]|uniref:Peptidase C14 caspase domain-containing protein n=1 Tax=Hydnum rufescens UP504 TaxID=1448309 RepID=A0A9P6AVS3_9AGAM|nr:hypothetical protein BS47DRAFT_1372759 [Hydnum rufescens UP504]